MHFCWVYKISNEEVLAKVEDRQIMRIIQQRQHHWIGHTSNASG